MTSRLSKPEVGDIFRRTREWGSRHWRVVEHLDAWNVRAVCIETGTRDTMFWPNLTAPEWALVGGA
jgi:hypothetical protein